MNIYQNKNNQNGFSLLEIIVALGIFSIIMLAVTSIFQTAIMAQRNAVASQNVQESLRYAFETMSKEIRMAQKNDGSCALVGNGVVYAGGGSDLYFKNQYGECVHYYWSNNQIMIDRADHIVNVTPDEVAVASLNFTVNNTAQPLATMSVSANLKINSGTNKIIRMQTTVSSRNYQ